MSAPNFQVEAIIFSPAFQTCAYPAISTDRKRKTAGIRGFAYHDISYDGRALSLRIQDDTEWVGKPAM